MSGVAPLQTILAACQTLCKWPIYNDMRAWFKLLAVGLLAVATGDASAQTAGTLEISALGSLAQQNNDPRWPEGRWCRCPVWNLVADAL